MPDVSRSALLQRRAALQREGVPFAAATVVARQSPTAAHLGDTAIVFEDGRVEGSIGGDCSLEIIRQQGLAALETGEPRLVRVAPETVADPPGYPHSADSEPEHYVRVDRLARARERSISTWSPTCARRCLS